MTEKYKVGSMFAGIGGICLGFKRNNCEIVWASEMDKHACETYRYNFDGAKYLVEGDIKDITAKREGESDEEHIQRVAKTIPDIDILNGGFPCQAFSIAGDRKGFEDDRGNLFFEIVTVLKAKKPKAFLLENVKNLKTHDKGNTFKVIKQELEKIGYTVKAEVLNSMEHGNIPQNRERIFIVGFLDEKIANKFEFPEKIKLTRTIADLINLDEKKDDSFYYNKTKYYEDLVRDMRRQDTIYQIRRGMYVRENKSNVCPTLTANMGTGGHNVPLIKDNYDIRKLTPEECLLFQGFNVDDDNHIYRFPEFMIDDKGRKRDYANSHKYKQAGNCVTVTVIERIVKNMLDAMESNINKTQCKEVALTIDEYNYCDEKQLDLDIGMTKFNLGRTLTSTVYVVNKGRVLLHMHKKYKSLFALGGHMMKNELPHETAIREVFEESGLNIELLNENIELNLGRVKQLNKPRHILLENIGHPVENIDFIFFAKTDEELLNPKDGESKELYWLTEEEIINNENIKPHIKEMALDALKSVR